MNTTSTFAGNIVSLCMFVVASIITLSQEASHWFLIDAEQQDFVFDVTSVLIDLDAMSTMFLMYT